MMKCKLLGKSGLRVSEIGLGTMTFGEDWGWGSSKDESRKVFDLYVERGGNLIDTANVYTNGTSERLTGEFIASDRGRFVVSTKYTLATQPDDPNAAGNHRKNMVQALEKSLGRLGTDYIDLYWVHAWDWTTPMDEVLRAFDDLVRAGKVLYVGISDVPAWVVSHATAVADLRGWTRFVGLQIEYSLLQRTVERELLPMARALDIGVTAWGALGRGVLSGKYGKGGEIDSKRAPINQARLTEKHLAIAAEVEAVARQIDRTPSQVAVNWVRQQPGTVIPLVGARTAAQLDDNLRSVDFELTPEQMARLDKASAIEMGFPHEFLGMDFIKKAVYGANVDRLIDHRKR